MHSWPLTKYGLTHTQARKTMEAGIKEATYARDNAECVR